MGLNSGLDLTDLDDVQSEKFEDFQSKITDLYDVKVKEDEAKKKKPSILAGEVPLRQIAGEVFTQTGRGLLAAFSWPLDVLKAGLVGSALSDIDELEEAYAKQGKPFDREKVIREVHEGLGSFPTGGLLEQKITENTGFDLEPRTDEGRFIDQYANIAGLIKGKIPKKLGKGLIAPVTSYGLETAGASETKARIVGDMMAFLPEKKAVAKDFTPEVNKIKNTADKYELPFLEFQAREKAPTVAATLSEAAEKTLKNNFAMSTEQAVSKIVADENILKRMQNNGVNLDVLSNRAYEVAETLAAQHPNVIMNTKPMVKNINDRIKSIKAAAPNPSDAEKASLALLRRERDILKVKFPTQEQTIKQYKNYNSNMKEMYKKPEFKGVEDDVRKTYEFLKDELVNTMETQGGKQTSEYFKAANSIYHQKSKLEQTENLLGKVFNGDGYAPRKLDKLLNSKQGSLLRRNMSKSAIEDIQQISKYGVKAEQKMAEFFNINDSAVQRFAGHLGSFAPYILIPNKLVGGLMSLSGPVTGFVQGKLLSRPATRTIYKNTLEHASLGQLDKLQSDFVKLENEVMKEYGNIDTFFDTVLEQIAF